MLQLIDKSGEVTVRVGVQWGGDPRPGGGGRTAVGPLSLPPCLPLQRLKEEVTQLKRSLQRAETEAKVLWEEMRGQEAKGDAAHVQERVLLRQEVSVGVGEEGGRGCGVGSPPAAPHVQVGAQSRLPILAPLAGGQAALAAAGEGG